MKIASFPFLLTVLAFAGVVDADGVETYPDFLKDDELEHFSSVKIDIDGATPEESIFFGISLLHPSIANRIHQVTVKDGDDARIKSKEELYRSIPISFMRSTTVIHADQHVREDGTSDDEVIGKVGFIFLETNKDADFVHGDDIIPVEAGTLVVFDGSVPHNTVVKSGTVRIAGAFHLESLTYVGPYDGCLLNGEPNDNQCIAPLKCICGDQPDLPIRRAERGLYRNRQRRTAIKLREAHDEAVENANTASHHRPAAEADDCLYGVCEAVTPVPTAVPTAVPTPLPAKSAKTAKSDNSAKSVKSDGRD